MPTRVYLTDDPSTADEISLDLLQKLDSLYSHYHKQWWCHRRLYYYYKRCHGCLNGSSLFVMAVGMIAGSVFKNSIIVTILSAVGTVIKGWNDFKKFTLKVDMAKFAFTTYEKALIELRTYVRGLPPEELDGFLIKMQTLDETISDFAQPVSDSCSHKYDSTFVYVPFLKL